VKEDRGRGERRRKEDGEGMENAHNTHKYRE
jgi:hypothetical protein